MLPHRESKDVFILGGIDDIQALLDDSMVNDSSFVKSVKGVASFSTGCRPGCLSFPQILKIASISSTH